MRCQRKRWISDVPRWDSPIINRGRSVLYLPDVNIRELQATEEAPTFYICPLVWITTRAAWKRVIAGARDDTGLRRVRWSTIPPRRPVAKGSRSNLDPWTNREQRM